MAGHILVVREFYDGFGRLMQRRASGPRLRFGAAGDDVGLPAAPGGAVQPAVASEAADLVLVTGWKTYDGRGRPLTQHEPFLSTGWAFQPAIEATRGRHITFEHDALGRLVRTRWPDGAEHRTVHGVPATLDRPDEVEPTPWELYVYDANDLAPLSTDPDTGASLAGRADATHAFTPVTKRLDAADRVVATIQREGTGTARTYVTRSVYDVANNLLEVIDPLGRPALRFVVNLLGRRLRTESLDGGLRTSVLDAENDLLEYRDAKGAFVVRRFDGLHRLTRLWAHDTAGAPMTLRERRRYGDDGNRAAARAANRLGKPSVQWDEAGRLEFGAYDFKGNVTVKTRRVVSDAALLSGWRADWDAPGAETVLETREHRLDVTYDAIGRPTAVRAPIAADGARPRLEVRHGLDGTAEQVLLDGVPFVAHVAHNARGQRVLLALGNGVVVRYRYDPRTMRLVALRSGRDQRSTAGGTVTWQAMGAPLQDLAYLHDLAGNIAEIDDRTPGCGITGSPAGRDRLTRAFTYTPLYRLATATGRACTGDGHARAVADAPRCGRFSAPFDPHQPTPVQPDLADRTEAYTETFAYDPLADLVSLDYAAASGPWSRRFGLGGRPPGTWSGAADNRVTALEQDGTTTAYRYDGSGNLRGDDQGRTLTWDYADRLIALQDRPPGPEAGLHESYFAYDAQGVRVKRVIRTAAETESKVFIDGCFEHVQSGPGPGRTSVHVLDGASRLAVQRRGSRAGDAAPDVTYHLGDHLDSSHVVVGADPAWVNREEYFAHGETSAGGFAGKANRFTGKEREAPIGLYYSIARYYAPWLARWISADPAGGIDGPSLYAYVSGNPVRLGDPTGTQQITDAERAFFARHPESFHKNTTGWETIVPYTNPIRIENTGQVGSPVYKSVKDAEAMGTAANASLWVSLGAFSLALAAEVGAGAALAGAKQMAEKAALQFALRNPRITVAIAGWLAAEAGVENPMPAGWASLAKTALPGGGLGIGAGFIEKVHGNSGQNPNPSVLYALYEKSTGLFLKWGITSEEMAISRYPGSVAQYLEMKIVQTGTREEMLALERFVVERIPGLWNREMMAGRAGGPQTAAVLQKLEPFWKYVADTFDQVGVLAGQWGPAGKR